MSDERVGGQSQAQRVAVEQGRAKEEKGGKARYCKFHSMPVLLDANVRFCPKCGEEYGGKEHTCPVCKKVTTMPTCPHCKGSYTCPKCGITVTSPVCPTCNAILDKSLTAVQAAKQAPAQTAPVRIMTQDEEQKLEESFRKEAENPDFKKFQKRLFERQKLLMERDYYNKMKKEIIEVFGAQPFSVELPDPAEQAVLMKMYASLERTIIDKQRHATQEELEAQYPELRHIHEAENRAAEEQARAEEEEQARRLEQEKRQCEMEEKYRAILEGIDQDIQQAKDSARNADEAQKAAERQRLLTQKAEEEAQLNREREAAEKAAREDAERRARIAAEEKRIAEERAREEAAARARAEAEAAAKAAADAAAAAAARAAAQAAAAARERAMQAAREEAARQAYNNRILGTWYGQNVYGNTEDIMRIEKPNVASLCSKSLQAGITYYYEFSITISGSQVKLRLSANLSHNPNRAEFFDGSINNNGTVITGYWTASNDNRNIKTTYTKMR